MREIQPKREAEGIRNVKSAPAIASFEDRKEAKDKECGQPLGATTKKRDLSPTTAGSWVLPTT